MDLRLEVITEVTRWHQIECEWRALYAASPSAAPPLSWEWTTLWWDVYGQRYGRGPDPLRVACVWRGEQLVAALPMYVGNTGCRISGSCVRFLSTGEEEFEETCADYLDLLYLPGEDQAAMPLMAERLQSKPNCVYLTGVSAESPLLSWVATFGEAGWWPKRTSLGPSWALDLSDGYDAWMAGLGKTSRRSSRRSMEQSLEVGATYQRAATVEDALTMYDELSDLHQQRWEARGKPGCFAAPRFAEFHRRLITALGPERAVLSVLRCGGQPVAANYGFLVGTKLHCYQAGTLAGPEVAVKSPGIAGYMHLIRDLADQGVTCLDFLLGAAPHKERLCRPTGELVRVSAAHPGLRAALCHLRESASAWRQRRRGASPPAPAADAPSDSP
ncbi:MAG: GNAT family N-acetyltransferase [Armatimonadetes bacterium]|nr:GNAT family N-acetyltransferase [Armatimonadota bacterium]